MLSSLQAVGATDVLASRESDAVDEENSQKDHSAVVADDDDASDELISLRELVSTQRDDLQTAALIGQRLVDANDELSAQLEVSTIYVLADPGRHIPIVCSEFVKVASISGGPCYCTCLQICISSPMLSPTRCPICWGDESVCGGYARELSGVDLRPVISLGARCVRLSGFSQAAREEKWLVDCEKDALRRDLEHATQRCEQMQRDTAIDTAPGACARA